MVAYAVATSDEDFTVNELTNELTDAFVDRKAFLMTIFVNTDSIVRFHRDVRVNKDASNEERQLVVKIMLGQRMVLNGNFADLFMVRTGY